MVMRHSVVYHFCCCCWHTVRHHRSSVHLYACQCHPYLMHATVQTGIHTHNTVSCLSLSLSVVSAIFCTLLLGCLFGYDHTQHLLATMHMHNICVEKCMPHRRKIMRSRHKTECHTLFIRHYRAQNFDVAAINQLHLSHEFRCTQLDYILSTFSRLRATESHREYRMFTDISQVNDESRKQRVISIPMHDERE